MALPDKLTDKILKELDFRVISSGKAKHIKYNSFRWKCNSCGLWFKQLMNERCSGCRKKTGR